MITQWYKQPSGYTKNSRSRDKQPHGVIDPAKRKAPENTKFLKEKGQVIPKKRSSHLQQKNKFFSGIFQAFFQKFQDEFSGLPVINNKYLHSLFYALCIPSHSLNFLNIVMRSPHHDIKTPLKKDIFSARPLFPETLPGKPYPCLQAITEGISMLFSNKYPPSGIPLRKAPENKLSLQQKKPGEWVYRPFFR